MGWDMTLSVPCHPRIDKLQDEKCMKGGGRPGSRGKSKSVRIMLTPKVTQLSAATAHPSKRPRK